MQIRYFSCDKLARDKAITIMFSKGIESTSRKLSPHEYIPYLKKKISEEALELEHARTESEMLDELVDISEAVQALTEAILCSPEKFQSQFEKKQSTYGRFHGRHCLLRVQVPDGHPDLPHFLKNKFQYIRTPH